MSTFGKELRDGIAPQFSKQWEVNPIVAIGLSTAILRLGLTEDELFDLCKRFARGLFATFHEDRRDKTEAQQRFSEAHNLLRDRQTFNRALNEFREARPQVEVEASELRRSLRDAKQQIERLRSKTNHCLREHSDLEKQRATVQRVFDTYLQAMAVQPVWDGELSLVETLPIARVQRMTVIAYHIQPVNEPRERERGAEQQVRDMYVRLVLRRREYMDKRRKVAKDDQAPRETAAVEEVQDFDRREVAAKLVREKSLVERDKAKLREAFAAAGMHEKSMRYLQRERQRAHHELTALYWNDAVAYRAHNMYQLATGRKTHVVAEAPLNCSDRYKAALSLSYNDQCNALLSGLQRWATVVTELEIEPRIFNVNGGCFSDGMATIVGSVPLSALGDDVFDARIAGSVLEAPAHAILPQLSPTVTRGHLLVTLPTHTVSVASQTRKREHVASDPVQHPYQLAFVVLDVR